MDNELKQLAGEFDWQYIGRLKGTVIAKMNRIDELEQERAADEVRIRALRDNATKWRLDAAEAHNAAAAASLLLDGRTKRIRDLEAEVASMRDDETNGWQGAVDAFLGDQRTALVEASREEGRQEARAEVTAWRDRAQLAEGKVDEVATTLTEALARTGYEVPVQHMKQLRPIAGSAAERLSVLYDRVMGLESLEQMLRGQLALAEQTITAMKEDMLKAEKLADVGQEYRRTGFGGAIPLITPIVQALLNDKNGEIHLLNEDMAKWIELADRHAKAIATGIPIQPAKNNWEGRISALEKAVKNLEARDG